MLDIAYGLGMDLICYASAVAIVTGIDFTPRHAELARSYLQLFGLDGIGWLSAMPSYMPFADDSFDLVSSNCLLHRTPDINAALL